MDNETCKKILEILMKQFKGEEGLVFSWLETERREWNWYSPMEVIKMGNADGVLRYLEQATHPEGDIFNG